MGEGFSHELMFDAPSQKDGQMIECVDFINGKLFISDRLQMPLGVVEKFIRNIFFFQNIGARRVNDPTDCSQVLEQSICSFFGVEC